MGGVQTIKAIWCIFLGKFFGILSIQKLIGNIYTQVHRTCVSLKWGEGITRISGDIPPPLPLPDRHPQYYSQNRTDQTVKIKRRRAKRAGKNCVFVGNGPKVGTFQKIVCKTHIFELFKLELWDIMSRKSLVLSQNMSRKCAHLILSIDSIVFIADFFFVSKTLG